MVGIIVSPPKISIISPVREFGCSHWTFNKFFVSYQHGYDEPI